ncbi:MAG: FUSC family protein [Cytophagaceae bacterium]|nr:FUSC family protein [Cytophagaceae bacterium]
MLFKKVVLHIDSFDFFKALIVSLMLVSPMVWAYQTNQYQMGFSVLIGVMFAYFPNIEGNQRHRIYGMAVGLFWSMLVFALQLSLNGQNWWVRLPIMLILVFISSMLSVYNQRGAMVSFGGMFAVVMGFAVQSFEVPVSQILLLSLLGGITYLVVGGLFHLFFQKRHSQLLLAECIELTADYLEKSEQMKLGKIPNNQFQLLKIQNQINENHELLRSILMRESKIKVGSNQSRRYYLIFREMIDIYEMSLATHSDHEDIVETFGDYKYLADPFFEGNEMIIRELYNFSECLRYNKTYEIKSDIKTSIEKIEHNISEWIAIKEIPAARDGALFLRNKIDILNKLNQKLALLFRFYYNLVEVEGFNQKKDLRFITTQDYSWKTLRSNLNTQSAIFRHSLRLSVAISLSFWVGSLTNPTFTNWIIVTCLVILRPNYGLTKSRAFSRMLGTLFGGILILVLVYFTQTRLIIGSLPSVSLLLGFSFVQRNYRLASAYITFSILALYILNHQEPFDIVLSRSLFTVFGVLISWFSIYFLWPVWEKRNIKEEILQALESNRLYFMAVNEVYKTKKNIGTEYRLIRKKAFINNGNLNSAFQRMQEEPKSKKDQANNIYAVVLLNHTFLSAVASFSAYIQGHTTTQVSEEFETVSEYIEQNLLLTIAKTEGKNQEISVENEEKVSKAIEFLDKKYAELNAQRNEELASGKLIMSTEMRNKLQEGKVILEQIKWLKNISESMLEAVAIL